MATKICVGSSTDGPRSRRCGTNKERVDKRLFVWLVDLRLVTVSLPRLLPHRVECTESNTQAPIGPPAKVRLSLVFGATSTRLNLAPLSSLFLPHPGPKPCNGKHKRDLSMISETYSPFDHRQQDHQRILTSRHFDRGQRKPRLPMVSHCPSSFAYLVLNLTFSRRHWGCVTERILKNMAEKVGDAKELDGFDDISPEDQAKIEKAWEEGHVAEEDIPDTAKKPAQEAEDDEDGGAKKKRRKAAAPKKKAVRLFRREMRLCS